MKRTLIPLLAVLAIGLAGVAYAAIPAANGTITACKDNKGQLKVIDAESGQTCAANQQPLTWNQQGPAGANGVSGYQVVYAKSAYDSAIEKSAVAFCPSGKKPVGGGVIIGVYANGSYLAPDGVAVNGSQSTGNGWGVVAREIVPYDGPWELTAQAICVTAL